MNKRIGKKSFYMVIALVLASALALPAMSEKNQPKIMIVKFHAEWCGTCTRLEPTLVELKEKFEKKPIQWVVLDLTDEKTQSKAAYLAESLGISNHLQENGRKTGSLRVLNASTKELISTLTKKMNKDEMALAISKALEHSE